MSTPLNFIYISPKMWAKNKKIYTEYKKLKINTNVIFNIQNFWLTWSVVPPLSNNWPTMWCRSDSLLFRRNKADAPRNPKAASCFLPLFVCWLMLSADIIFIKRGALVSHSFRSVLNWKFNRSWLLGEKRIELNFLLHNFRTCFCNSAKNCSAKWFFSDWDE